MNIFFLHWNPKICALWHVDKHVLKMIIEGVQLLASVHHMSDSDYKPVYKLTHKNHPCAIWARESLWNYRWLLMLTKELCNEYTYRYGKIHKCQAVLSDLCRNIPPIPEGPMTAIRLAMPDEYKYEGNPVKSYREYYKNAKSNLHSWKKREIPKWI